MARIGAAGKARKGKALEGFDRAVEVTHEWVRCGLVVTRQVWLSTIGRAQ
jgi:hypothetical protein